MLVENEPFTLFDIPEDKAVDTDSSIGSYFEIPTAEEKASDDPAGRRDTLFRKLSSKFNRSNDVDAMALRGIYGADFEGYAVVSRRANKRSLKFIGKNISAPKERFLFIKGPFCFVFKDELSPAPKYVIRLAYTRTRIATNNSASKGATTVMIEMTNEEVLEYELAFSIERYANSFVVMANRMALQGETEEIEEGLGHTRHLLHQSESVRYAARIATETMDNPTTDLIPSQVSTAETATYLRTPIGIY